MPSEIDQDKLDSANMKVLDINNPPTRQIQHQEFPKMLYLHPKDKTKEHKYTVVNSKEEQDAAQKKGYRPQPHVPVPPPENDTEDFEAAAPPKEPPAAPPKEPYPVAEETKRGPGRPPKADAN